MSLRPFLRCSFFFFNDTATTEIYTLSLHDALPISIRAWARDDEGRLPHSRCRRHSATIEADLTRRVSPIEGGGRHGSTRRNPREAVRGSQQSRGRHRRAPERRGMEEKDIG